MKDFERHLNRAHSALIYLERKLVRNLLVEDGCTEAEAYLIVQAAVLMHQTDQFWEDARKKA